MNVFEMRVYRYRLKYLIENEAVFRVSGGGVSHAAEQITELQGNIGNVHIPSEVSKEVDEGFFLFLIY